MIKEDSPFMVYIGLYCEDCNEYNVCIYSLEFNSIKERNEQITKCSNLRKDNMNRYNRLDNESDE